MKEKCVQTILLTLSLIACEQTVDPFEVSGPSSTSKQAGYLEGTWNLATVTPSWGVTLPCITDEKFTFAKTGVLTVDRGALRCTLADAQTVSGKWTPNKAFTSLTVTGWIWGLDSDSNIWSIDLLTEDEFNFHIDFFSDSQPYTISYKLVKAAIEPYSTTITEGAYLIKLKTDQSYIDLSSGNELKTSTTQRTWKIFAGPAGYYYIRPAGQINNVDQAIGAGTAILWEFHGGDNQQWKFQDAGDGYFAIQNRNNSKVIASPAPLANLVMENPNGNQNQLFRFIRTQTTSYEASGFSEVVPFGGTPFCGVTVQMKNVNFKFSFDGTTISNASLTNLATEIITSGLCAPSGTLTQNYTYLGGTVIGSNITIDFVPAPTNLAKCNVRFIGSFFSSDNNLIGGTLTWSRFDQSSPLLNYVVPYTLQMVR